MFTLIVMFVCSIVIITLSLISVFSAITGLIHYYRKKALSKTNLEKINLLLNELAPPKDLIQTGLTKFKEIQNYKTDLEKIQVLYKKYNNWDKVRDIMKCLYYPGLTKDELFEMRGFDYITIQKQSSDKSVEKIVYKKGILKDVFVFEENILIYWTLSKRSRLK